MGEEGRNADQVVVARRRLACEHDLATMALDEGGDFGQPQGGVLAAIPGFDQKDSLGLSERLQQSGFVNEEGSLVSIRCLRQSHAVSSLRSVLSMLLRVTLPPIAGRG